MDDVKENTSKDIELEYVKERDELIITLSNDGIEYLQNILVKLRGEEVGSHRHIDDFTGWLGGNIKHLIILKKD